MSDHDTKPKSMRLRFGINVNTLLSTGILAALAFGVNTLRDNVRELSSLREKIAVIEAINVQKVDQLNRIESRQATQQEQINSIQLDLARLKKTQ